MANTIKIKRGSGSDPAASDMVLGEPVLRTDTAELFFKKDDGSVAKVSGGGGGPDFKYLDVRNASNNGAASYPNADFTLVTSGTTTAISPAAANTLLVSVNGVIQKPNTGTSTPSSGFALNGSTIKFGSNISAAPDFILYQESGGIGEPSDNTVTSAKIVDGTIVNADINASAAIARTKLANVDVVDDTSPQLGGDLASNGSDILMADNDQIKLGTGNDLRLFHNSADSFIQHHNATTGNDLHIQSDTKTIFGSVGGAETHAVFDDDGGCELYHNNSKKFETYANGFRAANNGHIKLASDSGKFFMGAGDDAELFHDGTNLTLNGDGTNATFLRAKSGENSIKLIPDGGVELYHDNTLKFGTDSAGVYARGDLMLNYADNYKIKLGAGNDLEIYHDGSHTWMKNATGRLILQTDGDQLQLRGDSVKFFDGDAGETLLEAKLNGSVDLYYDDAKKFETTSAGVSVTGALTASGNVTAFSDVTLKEDINTISHALSKVLNLRGVSYSRKDTKQKGIGVVAQEIEKVLPEVVENGQFKSVAYGNIVALLIEAIKDLNNQIKDLKK